MAARLPLIDSNILVRHLMQDHANHSPRASAYMLRIRRREIVAKSNDLVLSETVYVLQSFYRLPKSEISNVLLPILALPNLKIPNKARLRKAFDLYVRYNLSFVDANLAAQAQQERLPELVSFDRNYDRVPGINRVEP